MYMVDKEDQKENSFGYINKENTIEYLKYDSITGMVILGAEDENSHENWYYPEEIPKLLKIVEHMKKYLIDEKII